MKTSSDSTKIKIDSIDRYLKEFKDHLDPNVFPAISQSPSQSYPAPNIELKNILTS